MAIRKGTVASSVFYTEPGAPTSVTGTAGNAQVSLSWTAPAFTGYTNITDYVIQYSTSATFASSVTTFSDGVSSSTSTTVTGLTNGTTYYFRVAAVNTVGPSQYSSISSSVVPVTTPSAVTSLSATASDRTITATWSAPTSDGGTAVSSYTVETQLNAEAWVNRGSQTSGVSFTVRNNSAATARSYKIRVTANNAVGAGTVATSGSVTPNFGTPETPTGTPILPTNPNNGANGSGARVFNVYYSPLQCAAFSSCQVHIAREGYEYQPYGNNVLLSTASNQANLGYTISNHYQAALGWYTPTASLNYYVFTRTFNTDGDYKDSAVSAVITTTATQSYVWATYGDNSYWGTEADWMGQTGQFTVTGNSFSQTSGFVIPGENTGGAGNSRYSVTSLDIEAWVGTSVTICTASRSFLVDFSGTSTSAGTGGGTQDCRTPPFSNNSGTTHRTLAWNVANVPYGNAGAGRIRVRGAGSIGTWSTSPDERIRVIVYVYGKTQDWVVSSYPIYTTYYF